MDVHSFIPLKYNRYWSIPICHKNADPPWIPVLAYLALMVNNFSSLPSYPCCRSRTLSAVANAEPHLFTFSDSVPRVSMLSLNMFETYDLCQFAFSWTWNRFAPVWFRAGVACWTSFNLIYSTFTSAVLRYGTIDAVDAVANATPSIKLQIFNESQFSVAGLRPKVKGAMNCAPCCPKKIAVALDLAQPEWRRKTSGRSGGGLLFSWRWNLWSRFYHPLQDNDRFWE